MPQIISKYCQDCGKELLALRFFQKYWATLYQCKNCTSYGYYILLADSRGNQELQKLELGVGPKLKTAKDKLIEEAFGKLRNIDYRTTSTTAFQHTILGCYNSEYDFEIIYKNK